MLFITRQRLRERGASRDSNIPCDDSLVRGIQATCIVIEKDYREKEKQIVDVFISLNIIMYCKTMFVVLCLCIMSMVYTHIAYNDIQLTCTRRKQDQHAKDGVFASSVLYTVLDR